MNKIKIKSKLLDFFQLPLLKNFVSIWGHQCTVICFHRVINDDTIHLEDGPNRNLCVTKTFFENLLIYLRKEFNVISIDEIKYITHLKKNKRYICITFDDGYIDNYLNAIPILKKYKIPATFFITNDFIDHKGIIWWYELWEILLKSNYLEFIFQKKHYSFKLNDKKKKIKSFYIIRKLILNLDISNIEHLFNIITKNKVQKSYSNYFMNWKQIIEIDKNNLFTIGSHTLSHPILKNETYEFVKKQMFFSKQILENKLKHEVKYIAYPFGRKHEANFREFKIAEDLGFEIGFTTNCKKEKNSNLFCVPRLLLIDYFQLNGIDVRLNGLSAFLGLQFG